MPLIKLTWKQKKVLSFINESESKQITKKEAMQLIDDHYCNGEKHVGETLSRMVKSGLLVRVKKGVFKTGPGKGFMNININQKDLFDNE